MPSRLALIAIVVEDPDTVEALNGLLHEYSRFIIGRMGVPCPSRGISLISVAVDAPQNVISELSGKVGRLSGINVKTAYANVKEKDEA